MEQALEVSFLSAGIALLAAAVLFVAGCAVLLVLAAGWRRRDDAGSDDVKGDWYGSETGIW